MIKSRDIIDMISNLQDTLVVLKSKVLLLEKESEGLKINVKNLERELAKKEQTIKLLEKSLQDNKKSSTKHLNENDRICLSELPGKYHGFIERYSGLHGYSKKLLRNEDFINKLVLKEDILIRSEILKILGVPAQTTVESTSIKNALSTSNGFDAVLISSVRVPDHLRDIKNLALKYLGNQAKYSDLPKLKGLLKRKEVRYPVIALDAYLNFVKRAVKEKYVDTPSNKQETESNTIELGPLVTHISGRGRKLQGWVLKTLSKEEVEKIDPYTFSKDRGWFVRSKHEAKLKRFLSGKLSESETKSERRTVNSRFLSRAVDIKNANLLSEELFQVSASDKYSVELNYSHSLFKGCSEINDDLLNGLAILFGYWAQLKSEFNNIDRIEMFRMARVAWSKGIHSLVSKNVSYSVVYEKMKPNVLFDFDFINGNIKVVVNPTHPFYEEVMCKYSNKERGIINKLFVGWALSERDSLSLSTAKKLSFVRSYYFESLSEAIDQVILDEN
ncbi:hypothetical protein BCS98_02565 [Vibrio breoganii]|uniref:hypothetical protein n=1 Tax=Vibrio breoganii TaxID=553239 RepID=UPI000C83D28E|nr:hypothetical protein [Vibrio breoganii]PML61743.1 hypothetical protein BCT73_01390 [Vibrio breoganii]PMO89317.1 hypothetical protein BCS98_02565 [Vibrio breoganii]